MLSRINQIASLLNLYILPEWLKNVFSGWDQMWHWPYPWDIHHRLGTKPDSQFSSLCPALWPRWELLLVWTISQLRLRKHSIPSSLEESEVGQSNCWTWYATLNDIEVSWSILSAFFFQGKEPVWFQDCWRDHYSSHKYFNYPMSQWPSTTF